MMGTQLPATATASKRATRHAVRYGPGPSVDGGAVPRFLVCPVCNRVYYAPLFTPKPKPPPPKQPKPLPAPVCGELQCDGLHILPRRTLWHCGECAAPVHLNPGAGGRTVRHCEGTCVRDGVALSNTLELMYSLWRCNRASAEGCGLRLEYLPSSDGVACARMRCANTQVGCAGDEQLSAYDEVLADMGIGRSFEKTVARRMAQLQHLLKPDPGPLEYLQEMLTPLGQRLGDAEAGLVPRVSASTAAKQERQRQQQAAASVLLPALHAAQQAKNKQKKELKARKGGRRKSTSSQAAMEDDEGPPVRSSIWACARCSEGPLDVYPNELGPAWTHCRACGTNVCLTPEAKALYLIWVCRCCRFGHRAITGYTTVQRALLLLGTGAPAVRPEVGGNAVAGLYLWCTQGKHAAARVPAECLPLVTATAGVTPPKAVAGAAAVENQRYEPAWKQGLRMTLFHPRGMVYPGRVLAQGSTFVALRRLIQKSECHTCGCRAKRLRAVDYDKYLEQHHPLTITCSGTTSCPGPRWVIPPGWVAPAQITALREEELLLRNPRRRLRAAGAAVRALSGFRSAARVRAAARDSAAAAEAAKRAQVEQAAKLAAASATKATVLERIKSKRQLAEATGQTWRRELLRAAGVPAGAVSRQEAASAGSSAGAGASSWGSVLKGAAFQHALRSATSVVRQERGVKPSEGDELLV